MSQTIASNKLAIMGAALAAQVLLAVVLFWQDSREAVVEYEPLLAVASDSIERIEITDGEQEVALDKQAGEWQLAGGLPVNPARVDTLVDNLLELKTGWPVTESASAHERFEVAADSFARKMTLRGQDAVLGTIYLGSSPSFKQVHMRREGDDAIYSLGFDSFQAAPKTDAWLAKDLLQPEGEVTEITAAERSVSKTASGWSQSAAAQEASPSEGDGEASERAQATETEGEDEFNAADFAEQLSRLTVLGVAENLADFDAPDAAQGGEEGAIQRFDFRVTTAQGEYAYELMAKGGKYYIARNDFERIFRISKNQYDELAKVRPPKASVAANS